MSEWWFPAAISRHAIGFDVQFDRTLMAAAIIFVVAQCALLIIAWRFRARARSARPPKKPTSSRLELVWTTATACLFLGLLFMGGHVWAGVQFTPAPPNSENIEVLAKQFAWNFRYPGPDGKFGRTDIHLIDDAANNPFGLDDRDPFAKDDITSATLRVPVGRPVKLTLTSRDVIHSFFVPAMRFKQDAVPGLMIHMHFRPEQTGDYEIACAELCGLGHYKMHGIMRVVSELDFQKWLAAREADKQ